MTGKRILKAAILLRAVGSGQLMTAAKRTAIARMYSDMDAFLGRIKSHGFTITAMAFQDAYTLDIDRLRRCSLHVCKGAGNAFHFAANYLTENK